MAVKTIDAQLEYLSCAANRFPHVASASASTPEIAFGSHKFVAFWEYTSDQGILASLSGFKSHISCVKFSSDSPDTLFVADNAGWLYLLKRLEGKWAKKTTIRAHEHGVSALYELNGTLVTGSSDPLLKIWAWSQEGDDIELCQEIDMKGKFVTCCSMSRLPDSQCIVIAVGVTGPHVHLLIPSGQRTYTVFKLDGHSDWIRSLAFTRLEGLTGDLFLASGSQDSTIRLWRLSSCPQMTANVTSRSNTDILDSLEVSQMDFDDEEGSTREISNKHQYFEIHNGTLRTNYQIVFDALLAGHEGSITALDWSPTPIQGSRQLLSSSSDASMIIWTSSGLGGESSNNIWTSHRRFGDIGGQRLGGFILGMWGFFGRHLFSCGWNGSFRHWKLLNEDAWIESPGLTGHNKSVTDLVWANQGQYIITTSADQTARIHRKVSGQWREFSRPQIHGYDLIGVVSVSPYQFISIADEKVARVFDAPQQFFASLLENGLVLEDEIKARPKGATQPPLGLSNKAIDDDPSVERELWTVPTESQLIRTLWPEVEKLFGHGYELASICVSNKRDLLVTACRSTTPEHAAIHIFSLSDFRPLGYQLSGHNLTVTRMAFSHDDQYLLSVSKDRTFCIFEHQDGRYSLKQSIKAHSRMILDCAWLPGQNTFITAGRDKQVKIWAIEPPRTDFDCLTTLKFGEVVTSVAVDAQQESPRLAAGLENGSIAIYSSEDTKSWKMDGFIDDRDCHVDSINRLSWHHEKLATCSSDGAVRMFDFKTKTSI